MRDSVKVNVNKVNINKVNFNKVNIKKVKVNKAKVNQVKVNKINTKLNDIYLYTIDDLRKVADESLDKRQDAARQARRTIDHEVQEFLRWVHGARAAAGLRQLRESAEHHARELAERALHQIEGRGHVDGPLGDGDGAVDEGAAVDEARAESGFGMRAWTHGPVYSGFGIEPGTHSP